MKPEARVTFKTPSLKTRVTHSLARALQGGSCWQHSRLTSPSAQACQAHAPQVTRRAGVLRTKRCSFSGHVYIVGIK